MGDLLGLVAIAGAFGIPLLAIWTKHQSDMRKHDKTSDSDVRRLTDEVELLQDRVQVLERIVTDRGYDLASQIEALRDSRGIEQPLNTNSTKETSR